MISIKQLLIFVVIFIFFISCGASKDHKDITVKKVDLKERFAKVKIEDKKSISPSEDLNQRKLKLKKPIQTKGMLASTTSGGIASMRNEEIGFNSVNRSTHTSYNSNTENYAKTKENKLKQTIKEPISTFSIDVDTASYSLFKSMIKNGDVNRDAVRTEEFINYFNYDYPQPKDNKPFSVTTEVGPSILNKDRHIIHIGIQGLKKAEEKRKNANLVFLIDTSGSMYSYNKLPLLQKSLNILINNLTKKDIITIVTYAGDFNTALEPTSGANKNKIKEAINSLTSGGGTNGEGGINEAYKKAMENFDKNKINRIILCTDGDFNIGVNSVDELKELVKEKRKTGVSLSTVGFGRGNYNDAIMEKLADNGNGNYFYINNINEAKKVFSKELTGNLETIAKDVKIQVEFNKKYISFYRLIGYENRILNKEDFNNDKKDAGEIGIGHTVTALYEVVFTNEKNQPIDTSRYQNTNTNATIEGNPSINNELAFVKLRYKNPNENKSILITQPILEKNIIKTLEKTSNNFRFSSAVAAFALKIKNSDSINISNDKILEIAKNSKGSDEFGYKAELLSLIKRFKNLKKDNFNNDEDSEEIDHGGCGAGRYEQVK